MASFLVVAETAGQRAPPWEEASSEASSGKASERAAAKSERSSARRLGTRAPPVAEDSAMFAASGSDMRGDARERQAKEKAERWWRRSLADDQDGETSGDR